MEKESFRQKISKMKISLTELTIMIMILAFSCLIIMPSIIKCINNKDKSKCEHHIYRMLGILSDGLIEEEESGDAYWHDLIKNGNYRKLIASLNEKADYSASHSASEYYIETGDNSLSIRCKKHPDMSEKTIKFSLMQNVNVEMFSGEEDKRQILYLDVSGPNTYYEGYSLDNDNLSKMVFRGREVDKVIDNLRVTAVYTDGTSEELPLNRYTVMTTELDMRQTGQKTLTVTADVNYMWSNSMSTVFTLNVISRDEMMPLVINSRTNGRYELASRSWKEFTEEASEEEYGKKFGASIVRYNSGYYYYPDGFIIINADANDDMFNAARNTENMDTPADYVKFDARSVSDDEDDADIGSVKIENDEIYIRQGEEKDSWIRVDCKIKKY